MAINDTYTPAGTTTTIQAAGPTAMQAAFEQATAKVNGPIAGPDAQGEATAADVVAALSEVHALKLERADLYAQLEHKTLQLSEAFASISELATTVGVLQGQMAQLIQAVKPAPADETAASAAAEAPEAPQATPLPRKRPALSIITDNKVKSAAIGSLVIGTSVAAYGYYKGWFNGAAEAVQEAV